MVVDEFNEEFFSQLEARIKSLIPHEFSLIKTNERGDRSVSFKVYPNSAGAMGCKFSRRVGRILENVDPDSMTNSKVSAQCVLKISDFFIGSVKTVRIVPQEFLLKEIERPETSFFMDDVDDGED